jgi:hypothetical protein
VARLVDSRAQKKAVMDEGLKTIYYAMLKENVVSVFCEQEGESYALDITYRDEYSKRQYLIFTLSPKNI